jgi:hypothetical protein
MRNRNDNKKRPGMGAFSFGARYAAPVGGSSAGKPIANICNSIHIGKKWPDAYYAGIGFYI